MEKIRFGKTELIVSRTGFGAIPIQRISEEDAVSLLRRAYDGGVTLYDTARRYSDSETKIGKAFAGMREKIVICSKTIETTREAMLKDLEESLKDLQTDYIDVYQIHNPKVVPKRGDEAYETLLEMKSQGKIRHLGLSNHNLQTVIEAVKSDLYDVVQYPLSPLSSPEEFELTELCKKHDVGFLAMKALAGGIITQAITSFVTLRQYENVVPIWGMQSADELDEIIGYENNPPAMTDEIRAIIKKDRDELSGAFCRGCGYCLPCPADINISFSAKMSHSIFRMDGEQFFTDAWYEKMHRISNCTHCNHCVDNCPYGLNTPELLASELEKYKILYDLHSKGLPLKKIN